MKQQGFTLIEIVISISIMIILSVFGIELMTNLFKVHYQQEIVNKLTQHAGYAMWRMGDDFSHVRVLNTECSSSGSSNFSITDIDQNTISYQLTVNQLQRDGIVLAKDISSLSFYCLDDQGNKTDEKEDTKYMMIDFKMQEADISQHLRTSIFLRNKD